MVLFSAEPIDPKWKATLCIPDLKTGEPIVAWRCEHTHAAQGEAYQCARTELEHLIEMLPYTVPAPPVGVYERLPLATNAAAVIEVDTQGGLWLDFVRVGAADPAFLPQLLEAGHARLPRLG